MYLCKYVYMCVCMYVCMHPTISYVYVLVCLYVCIYICMYVSKTINCTYSEIVVEEPWARPLHHLQHHGLPDGGHRGQGMYVCM